jgi:predicted nucleic acid-binding protein
VVFLDTTVLVFATGGDHALRAPAQRLLKAHRDGEFTAAVTVEVLQELAHVKARRLARTDIALLVRDLAIGLEVVSTTAVDLDAAMDIFARNANVGAFDAVLAAAAIGHDAALVSADKAFGDVAELRWIDLASPHIDRLVLA